MKKIVLILGLLLVLVGCSNKKEQKVETLTEEKTQTKDEQNDSKISKDGNIKQDLKAKFSELSDRIVGSVLNTDNMQDEDYKKHLKSESKKLDEELSELDKIKTDNKEENEIITKLKSIIDKAKSLYMKVDKTLEDKEISGVIEEILEVSDKYFGGEIPPKLDKIIKDNMR